MDLEPCFKVHNFVSVHPESIKLGQMTNLIMIFHLVVSDYWLLEIWNWLQFPAKFRNSQCLRLQKNWTHIAAFCHYLWVISTHKKYCFTDKISICFWAILITVDLVNKELLIIATYLWNIWRKSYNFKSSDNYIYFFQFMLRKYNSTPQLQELLYEFHTI